MGYDANDAMVQVDFFKADGNGRPRKWGYREAVRFIGDWDQSPQVALMVSLREHLKRPTDVRDKKVVYEYRMMGTVAVCLEPYVKNPYPVCAFLDDRWWQF